MKGQSIWVKLILVVCVIAAIVVFSLTYLDASYQVEEISVASSTLDKWQLEKSELNGAPLYENKNIYTFENNSKINNIYITVFPTEDKKGKMRTFKNLDLLTAANKVDIFDLDASIIYGDKDGNLNQVKNPDIVNATLKARGSSSLNSAYKSYKLNLMDGTELFFGQKTLNFNKHAYDISKVSNKFCMDIMSTIPNMSSLRTNFVVLYIRDAALPKKSQKFKYYGLFTQVEQPNRTFLKVRGFDVNGSLYKAANFEFKMSPALKNVNEAGYNVDEFSKILEIREGVDHSKLIDMIKDINDPNLDFMKMFKKHFNEDNYLTWMATNIILGNEDTISQNFLLYSPKNALTWYFMPWDYDGTFKFGANKSNFEAPISLKGIQRLSSVMLHRRFFRQPGNILKLTNKIRTLLDTVFTEKKVQALVDSYKPVLAKVMTKAPDIIISRLAPNEINAYLNDFYKQIRVNYSNYIQSNKYPAPVFVSEPIRNKNGTIQFGWEPTFDYNGNLDTYGIEFSKDPYFKRDLINIKGLTQTQFLTKKKFPKGTYCLRITITDSRGNVQKSLDIMRDLVPIPEFGAQKVTFR